VVRAQLAAGDELERDGAVERLRHARDAVVLPLGRPRPGFEIRLPAAQERRSLAALHQDGDAGRSVVRGHQFLSAARSWAPVFFGAAPAVAGTATGARSAKRARVARRIIGSVCRAVSARLGKGYPTRLGLRRSEPAPERPRRDSARRGHRRGLHAAVVLALALALLLALALALLPVLGLRRVVCLAAVALGLRRGGAAQRGDGARGRGVAGLAAGP